MEKITKQKRICFITHLPNLTGANQSLLDLLDGLDRENYKIFVLMGKNGPLAEELQKRNVEYHIMGYSTDIKEKNPVVNVIKIFKSQMSVYRICRFLKREKIDIVHNNTLLVWAGMEAARRSQIKYVCHVREMVWLDHQIKLLHEKKQFALMENADKTIFISDYVKKYFLEHHHVKNYVMIKDGFNTERYLNKNHAPLFEQNPVKIVIAGRITPGKGQMDAVKAVVYLNENKKCQCRLTVVGPVRDALYAEKMKEYIGHNHQEENITFLPFCDLGEIRAEHDIELVCSAAEGLGRVTVESMLSGCLTIGANAGATPEIIRDGENGYLYPFGDYMELANVIAAAVTSEKKKIKKLQECAISQCMEEFHLSRYALKIAGEYEEILDEEKREPL